MGFFETVCQLYGVSFGIVLLRRPDEPSEASWDYTGSDYVDEDEELSELCGESSGCQLLPHDGSETGEHMAGSGCISTRGYSGQRSSLEEMKGSRAVQCLVKKDSNWEPEPDGQDFELESECFLTGMVDGSPDEAPLENIMPFRHDIDIVIIANCIYCVSPA